MESARSIYEVNAKLKAEREARNVSLEHPLATVKRLIRKFRLSRYWQREEAKARASFLRVTRNHFNVVRTVPRERESSTGGPASSPGPGDDDEDGPDQPARSSGATSPFKNSTFIKLKFSDSRGATPARRAFAVAVLAARWLR